MEKRDVSFDDFCQSLSWVNIPSSNTFRDAIYRIASFKVVQARQVSLWTGSG